MTRAAALRKPADVSPSVEEEKTAAFLQSLTALSEQHGIGITGSPVLFVMEQDDTGRAYRIDNESALHFD